MSVRRDGIWALQKINLRVGAGEMVTIVGPPGAGKTTLLKALAGLLPVHGGQLSLDGVRSTQMRLSAWQSQMGFAFQNNALFDTLSVFDNVAFTLQLRGIKEAEIRERVHARLQEMNLYEARALMPRALSGGMAKRLALARATITEPRVGLFDEPTAGLDPHSAVQIVGLLLRLTHSLGMVTLVVSNDFPAFFPVTTQLIMLCAGCVAYQGPPYAMVRSARAEVVQFATGSDSGPL